MPVDVRLSDELVDCLGQGAFADLAPEVRVRRALAAHLYETQQVSLRAAADLADMSYRDFWEMLVELGLPVFAVDKEQAEADAATLGELLDRNSVR